MPLLRAVARHVVSAWCWVYFLSNTLARFTIALALSTFRDPHEAFGRRMQSWASSNLRYGGQACDVTSRVPLPVPAVILVNHQHFFDIELVTAIVPPPLFFVARVEVERIVLVGSVLRRAGHILLERGNGASSEKAIQSGARRIAAGGRVVFFGEGTRSKDGGIHTMRSGAFRLAARTGAPLVPLVLAGTRFTFPDGLWPIVPARMAAEFLPPRTVTQEQARSTAYREAVRGEMAEALSRIVGTTGSRM